MQKKKTYRRARFSAEVLERATQSIWPDIAEAQKAISTLLVKIDDASWTHDNFAEFFADYRRSTSTAFYWLSSGSVKLEVSACSTHTDVAVQAPNRSSIEATFTVFEAALPNSLLPEPVPEPRAKPTVFIGHGRNDD